MAYWLMKSEPDEVSIDDLAAAPRQTVPWFGVRNYQARNFMRDEMKLGDLVLFYHSSVQPPGVAGIAKVVRESHPDHTSWDPAGEHFDPKSTPAAPRWFMVAVQLVRKLPRLVTLEELRAIPDLAGMPLLNRSRLSVQPVTPEQYALIVALAEPSRRSRSA